MTDWSKLIRDANPVVYPHMVKSENRVQVMYSESRYAILLNYSNIGFWCGYVLVTCDTAVMLESEIARLGISYIAPAGRSVTWMGPTRDGRLRVPMALLDPEKEPEGDFWVGFDRRAGEYNEHLMLEILDIFEKQIRDFEKEFTG